MVLFYLLLIFELIQQLVLMNLLLSFPAILTIGKKFFEDFEIKLNLKTEFKNLFLGGLFFLKAVAIKLKSLK